MSASVDLKALGVSITSGGALSARVSTAEVSSARKSRVPMLNTSGLRQQRLDIDCGSSAGSPRDYTSPGKATAPLGACRVRTSRYANTGMISPREYVRVSSGADRTEHLSHYHMHKTFVPNQHKVEQHLVPKNKTGDFISTVVNGNKMKLAPSQYNPSNANMFSSEATKIHFPIAKANRTTVFAEKAKKQEWVPAPNAYKPERKEKLLGNFKQ